MMMSGAVRCSWHQALCTTTSVFYGVMGLMLMIQHASRGQLAR